MSYQLYRHMSLGESLQEALDDLIMDQRITPDLAAKVSYTTPSRTSHCKVSLSLSLSLSLSHVGFTQN